MKDIERTMDVRHDAVMVSQRGQTGRGFCINTKKVDGHYLDRQR